MASIGVRISGKMVHAVTETPAGTGIFKLSPEAASVLAHNLLTAASECEPLPGGSASYFNRMMEAFNGKAQGK